MSTATEEVSQEEEKKPGMIECEECGCEVEEDSTYWAELDHKKDGGDVCWDCYHNIVSTCTICGDDDVMPSQISRYALLKQEAAKTMGKPPGVYRITDRPFYTASMLGGGWMDGSRLRFIDKLPKPDHTYDLSGHICNKCALPYAKIAREAYKHATIQTALAAVPSENEYWRESEAFWAVEKAHTKAVILANPDMLRDLECDQVDRDEEGNHITRANAGPWEDLQEKYDLPDGLPTYHVWLAYKYRGVSIYCGYRGDRKSWLTLIPEPRGRHCGVGNFDASSLPNWGRHQKEHAKKTAKRIYRMMRDIRPERPLSYYEDQYRWDSDESVTKAAVLEAIRLGALTQNGVASRCSRKWGRYRWKTLSKR